TYGGITNVADHAPPAVVGTTMKFAGPVAPCTKLRNDVPLQPGPALPRRVTTVPTGPDVGVADNAGTCAIAGVDPAATRRAPGATMAPANRVSICDQLVSRPRISMFFPLPCGLVLPPHAER